MIYAGDGVMPVALPAGNAGANRVTPPGLIDMAILAFPIFIKPDALMGIGQTAPDSMGRRGWMLWKNGSLNPGDIDKWPQASGKNLMFLIIARAHLLGFIAPHG